MASFSLISLTYKKLKSTPEYYDPIFSTSINLFLACTQCLLIVYKMERLPTPLSPNTNKCDSRIKYVSLWATSLRMDYHKLECPSFI
jgi:hypothetical protein